MVTSKLAVMGVFALALALVGGFVVITDDADADTYVPTITWAVADADDGVELTYTLDKKVTADEIAGIFGSSDFDATYTIPFTFNGTGATAKTINDVPSGLVPYFGDSTITIAVDSLELITNIAGEDKIITIDLTDGKVITTVQIVIDVDAELLTYEEIVDIMAAAQDGLYTEEQYQAALATVPAGYVSADDAKAAADKAVEDYKAANPVVKDDNTMFILAIGLLGIFAIFELIILILAIRTAKREGRKLW